MSSDAFNAAMAAVYRPLTQTCDCGRPSQHPARHVKHGGKSACIDEQLADLVLLLWRLGVATSESCQRDGDHAALHLAPQDCERWINLMLAGGDEEIYYSVFDAGDVPSGWTFSVGGHITEEDDSVVVQEAADDEVPMYRTTGIALSIGVQFPKGDLNEIIGRLRATASMALG